MGNQDDQNDLYQEIIYQGWKSYENFQHWSDFLTWLYRTAFNTAIIFLRSEKKRSFIQNQRVVRLSTAQEFYNDSNDQDMKLMYEAIYQLSPIDKTLIFFFRKIIQVEVKPRTDKKKTRFERYQKFLMNQLGINGNIPNTIIWYVPVCIFIILFFNNAPFDNYNNGENWVFWILDHCKEP